VATRIKQIEEKARKALTQSSSWFHLTFSCNRLITE
jgi:hypothetical protein